MFKGFRFGSMVSAALLVAGMMGSAHGAPVEFTDLADRKVVVDVPAKRVVLGFYYQDYLAVAGTEVLDNVVGFSKAVWTDWAPASWAAFSQALPKLNELDDIGEVESRYFFS